MDRIKAAAIMEENMKTVFAYALSRTGDKNDAEDLAGDIIVNFLASAGHIRDDRAVFGYFWTIAANTARRFFSRRSKEYSRRAETEAEDDGHDFISDIPDPDTGDISDDMAKREDIMTLRRELSVLAKEYRECTVAYYFDGLSCRQIAEQRNISVEMVKYYLYKTRRILREGMNMTRELGERSYRPAVFHFNTIFEGQYNREYRNLFSRKLPGNILYSAYYTPMTVGELSVELGVAAVYLEDEIALLEKYGLITKTAGEKYQTRLIIFTEDFGREFFRSAEKKFVSRLGAILGEVKKKLPMIREMKFPGCGMSDNRLLWALYFDLIRRGHWRWKGDGNIGYAHELYAGARGVNYAVDYEEDSGVYSCSCFAGFYGGIMPGAAACMADFGVLGEKNFFGQGHNYERMGELVKLSMSGDGNAPLAFFRKEQIDLVFDEILADEVGDIGELYRELEECAAEIMQNHAPKAVRDEADAVLKSTIFHRTVGLLGKMAVDSGELTLPDDDLPCAVYLIAHNDGEHVFLGDCS